MVLGLEPMEKLIAFGNYLSVRQNQDLAWSSNYKPVKKKQTKKISQSKNRKSFLINKIMIYHIQNSRGRLILKLTTEQLREAYLKANYRTAEKSLS